MKKLLLIGSGYIHTYNFAHLIESCFDEILLIADKDDATQNIKTVVVDFSLKKITNHFNTVVRIRNIIAEFNPSIIHIHQANSFAYYALRAAAAFKIPTILTAWGSDVLLLPHSNFLMKQMVKFNLKSATALTADAHFMAEAMAQLSGRKLSEILIANFGIEVENIPAEKENIIYSNRLHKPLYRIDKIITAFSKFYKTGEGKSWKLIVAATGSETESLKKLTVELGLGNAVEFAGWVDKHQNAKLYARSKVYVSIPESDGTSISLLEAMAYDCLPVVSDLPANREWIGHLKNGFIVADINDDFLLASVSMDLNAATVINKSVINEKGLKSVNREKFNSLYNSLLN